MQRVFEKLDVLPEALQSKIPKIKEVLSKNLNFLANLPSYGIYFPFEETASKSFVLLMQLPGQDPAVFDSSTAPCVSSGSFAKVLKLFGSDPQISPVAVKILKDAAHSKIVQKEIEVLNRFHEIEGIQSKPYCSIYRYDMKSDHLDQRNLFGFASRFYSERDLFYFLETHYVASQTLSSAKAVAIMNRLIQANAELIKQNCYSIDVKVENVFVHLDKLNEEGDYHITADMCDLCIRELTKKSTFNHLKNQEIISLTYNTSSQKDYEEQQRLLDSYRTVFSSFNEEERYQEIRRKEKEVLERILVRQLGAVAYSCFFGVEEIISGSFEDKNSPKHFYNFDKVFVGENPNVDESIRIVIEQMLRQTISFDEMQDRWKDFSSLQEAL